jgi:N-acyl-D-glutamate deacylase
VDADADIVAFDLATVSDQATYADSCRVAAGIQHLLVNGVPLIRDGRLDTAVLPGRPVRAS